MTKHIGTAARSKAFSAARCSRQAGLQLKVAKRIVTAAQKVVLDHSVTLVIYWIAVWGCYSRRIGTYCVGMITLLLCGSVAGVQYLDCNGGVNI